MALPAGACDCHAHVFAPAGVYPYAERRPYTPADGTGLAAYRAMLAGIGATRAVLVHSNIYGPDNRATTDALADMGGAFRGIALIRPEIDRRALQALAAAGMRGIKINLEFPGETTLDDMTALSPRLARLGWHLQVLVRAERLPAAASRLLALPLDLVIDHMGLPSAAAGLAGVRALLPLLATGRSGSSFPRTTTSPRRRARARRRRTRAPPENRLATALAQHEAGLDQVLVRNPVRLYGFDAP